MCALGGELEWLRGWHWLWLWLWFWLHCPFFDWCAITVHSRHITFVTPQRCFQSRMPRHCRFWFWFWFWCFCWSIAGITTTTTTTTTTSTSTSGSSSSCSRTLGAVGIGIGSVQCCSCVGGRLKCRVTILEVILLQWLEEVRVAGLQQHTKMHKCTNAETHACTHVNYAPFRYIFTGIALLNHSHRHSSRR